MTTISAIRTFMLLLATAAILVPADHLLAGNHLTKKERMVSILDLSPPPSLPRAEMLANAYEHHRLTESGARSEFRDSPPVN